MSGGCSGPGLSLALDEKKDADAVFEYDGLNFLVDSAVTAACGAINVDYVQETSGCGCSGSGGGAGFSVSSERPLSAGGGRCGRILRFRILRLIAGESQAKVRNDKRSRGAGRPLRHPAPLIFCGPVLYPNPPCGSGREQVKRGVSLPHLQPLSLLTDTTNER